MNDDNPHPQKNGQEGVKNRLSEVSETLTTWINSLSLNSARSYRSTVFKYLKFNKNQIETILSHREINVICFLNTMVEKSNSTHNVSLCALKSMFDQLVRAGYMKSNPAKHIKAKKSNSKHQRPLEKERIEQIIEKRKILNRTPRVILEDAIIGLLVSHGLRRFEVCELRVSDCLDDGRLLIRGKGNRVDEIILTPNCKNAISEWLEVRDTFYKQDDIGSLFLNRSGGPISREWVWRLSRKVFKANPHSLRAFSITQVYLKSDLLTAKRHGRHVQISTTEAYLNDSYQDRLVKVCPQW
jgi:integrase/recombinase XerD